MYSVSIQDLRDGIAYDPSTGNAVWMPREVPMFGGTLRGLARWNKIFSGRIVGSNDKNGYRRVNLAGRDWFVHRVVWAIYYGEWPVGCIDHINTVRDDNRISNLRQCTKAENSRNSRLVRSASGFRGVVSNGPKYQAQIRANGRGIYLGLFASPEAAAIAYDNAAERLHGKFSSTNIKLGILPRGAA